MTQSSFISIRAGALLAVFAFSACESGPRDVRERVSLSVEENARARSAEEWQLADNHPRQIMSDLRASADETAFRTFCDSLRELEARALQIYEPQLNDEANAGIFDGCREDLRGKLRAFHEENRLKMREKGLETQVDATRSQARLPLKIEVRDVSKGYVAVTGDVGPKEVVLTFDDGPDPSVTAMILRALEKYGVKALFFQTGRAALANPSVSRLVAESGHVVANHSLSHPYMGDINKCKSNQCREKWVPPEVAREEIRETHRILFETVGHVEPFFRFPFGAKVPELGQFLKDNQTAEFFWNIDSNDWNMSHSNEQVLESTLAQLQSKGRGIVLFHDVHQRTAEILPEFLRRLSEGGYTVVLLRASDDSLRVRHPFLQPLP